MKRLIISAFVAGMLGASLFTPAVAQPGAGPSGVAAKPAPTIDTYVDWTGDYIWPFGSSDTSTYGQVITIPVDETALVRFRFYMSYYEGTGHLVLRGEVYRWDGTKATGSALWEGDARRLALNSAATYRRVGFHVGGVELTAGAQYVLFASISKNFEQSTPGYHLKWATADDSAYQPGTLVYLNNGTDQSQWTSATWDTSWGSDLAFKAWLRPAG